MRQPVMKGLVICDNHSPLSGRYCFISEEAECAEIAEVPNVPAIQARSERLGAIFDDKKAVSIRNLPDCKHVAGMPVKMNGQNSSGAGRDFPDDIAAVRLPRVRRRVYKYGGCARVGNSVYGSDVS